MMFPPHLDITVLTSTSCPGLSSSAICILTFLPLELRPRVKTLDKIFTSILPPDTTQTTFFPFTGILLAITAATAVAPAPSDTSFCFSIRASIAIAISSSETVTISSTYLFTISKVRSPGCFTAIPSANVDTVSRVICFFCFTLSYIDGAFAAWTPYTFILGFKLFIANATPDISPPPPIGTTTASILSSWSSISRPIVP